MLELYLYLLNFCLRNYENLILQTVASLISKATLVPHLCEYSVGYVPIIMKYGMHKLACVLRLKCLKDKKP